MHDIGARDSIMLACVHEYIHTYHYVHTYTYKQCSAGLYWNSTACTACPSGTFDQGASTTETTCTTVSYVHTTYSYDTHA